MRIVATTNNTAPAGPLPSFQDAHPLPVMRLGMDGATAAAWLVPPAGSGGEESLPGHAHNQQT